MEWAHIIWSWDIEFSGTSEHEHGWMVDFIRIIDMEYNALFFNQVKIRLSQYCLLGKQWIQNIFIIVYLFS